MAVSGVARSKGGWPAAVFYPFGQPMPYAFERDLFLMLFHAKIERGLMEIILTAKQNTIAIQIENEAKQGAAH
jgi:ribosomal protein L25 (general stress protein Ctc)